jgi:hypothetical protein
MTMELTELVGLHVLTGVDFGDQTIERYGSLENSQVMNFVLDGVTYSAVEDPDDGYRSMMGSLLVSDVPVKNTFAGVTVMGIMRGPEQHGDGNDILDLYDVANAKPVLSVGTDYSDGYYPSFVAVFSPENLHVNAAQNSDY